MWSVRKQPCSWAARHETSDPFRLCKWILWKRGVMRGSRLRFGTRRSASRWSMNYCCVLSWDAIDGWHYHQWLSKDEVPASHLAIGGASSAERIAGVRDLAGTSFEVHHPSQLRNRRPTLIFSISSSRFALQSPLCRASPILSWEILVPRMHPIFVFAPKPNNA